MKKIIKMMLLVLFVVPFLSLSSLGFAKEKGPDKPRHGFEQGEKKGWKGEEYPPGWSHGEKNGWGEKQLPPGLRTKENDETEESSG